MTGVLPPPRPTRADGSAPYRLAVVCLGNICRSPVADVVIEARLAEAGLGDAVEVRSFGTGGWHVGGPMDERSAAVLTRGGYDATRHRARRLDAAEAAGFDALLGMDATNVADVRALAGGAADRVLLFRDLDPEGTGDVPDPYAGGPEGFDATLAVVERVADALVAELGALLRAPSSAPTGGAA
ncbi:low molecular weight protein-tyrosine-phosphatase [Nocardioides sp. ChNu-99]|uniref:low molecular weight protein-tyrosine-phosphatase n=1 Tax=Nocardioides sp. ChNu-99 TaxID=2839897 RepID=UPI00240547E4|nr:low molecular weight protein-tyrosine-phosphatase [Nocardioides sp. ChNu-99]MDF9715163.1 low molecular weight phosphotyrosine protein phosphatase [Nocardioides sp. ChNu-99]